MHDLITSYLKEKEKVTNSQQNPRSGSPNLNVINNPTSSTGSNLNLEKNSVTSSSNSSVVNDSNSSLNISSGGMASGSSVKNLNLSNSNVNLNANQEDLRHLVGNKKITSNKAEKDKDKDNKMDLEAFMKVDFRHFNCKTWHLEPTVR